MDWPADELPASVRHCQAAAFMGPGPTRNTVRCSRNRQPSRTDCISISQHSGTPPANGGDGTRRFVADGAVESCGAGGACGLDVKPTPVFLAGGGAAEVGQSSTVVR